MPFKHDWDKVKREYVEGTMDKDGNLTFSTLEDLSKKFKISFSTIRNKSARDGWPAERDIFQARLDQRRRENRIEILAGKASEFDAGIFRAAEIGLGHIKMHFVIANEKMNAQPAGKKEPLSITALDRLSKALERFQRVGRLALGEPTEIGAPADANTTNINVLSELTTEELRKLANLTPTGSEDKAQG